ncbi:uncharacterized protein SPPG_04877 [Spizellomyces punctatus DAOM BR117]|uniref:glutathione transferase n=1 Tax=Spizellomyces punctatus (strain DAOM BR117) TaxID=645134 RepID=A0A0L0HIC9_SPIPD|nr:uncharacterized protein SPPG_04877 [Spizellomyces punctatus DAOM BR117]KND00569.1 hypothetical protein SPPG_04877 [Spizellomyces punctatus DAOM BR117]|eukprot:XP_016608608.1 hypothetical protein SPPG_04877 [Spizellomyces punctatus DAOM BR117]
MGIKVHGAPFSTCTQRVAVVLREKNVPFEIVPVNFAAGQHKSEEFLKLQPFGQVPVLEDDGFFLFESRAIGRYIENKYKSQGTSLAPSDLKGAAVVEQWASVEVANFDPYASGIVAELVFKKLFNRGEPDLERVKQLRAKLDATLDVYDKILAKQPFLTGQQVSLADLFHLPYGAKLFVAQHGDAITSRPNVKAWWERLTSRPTWQETAAAGAH